MIISEVITLTGLTKKAVNYYEEEGLIKPEQNGENNYRYYSKKDVERLLQISVMRQLDVPVKDIREILSQPARFKEIMEQHLKRLEEQKVRVEKSQTLLRSCMESLDQEKAELPHFTRQLALLNEALEMDERGREGFIKRQLQRIFPGNFGRLFAAYYGPFLNEPVDTAQKEEAWLKLVQYLDESENMVYSGEMAGIYESLTDADVEKCERFAAEDIRKWMNVTESEMASEREKFLDAMAKINKDPEALASFQKTVRMSGDLKKEMGSRGYYQQFVDNLKILSSDFLKYNQNKAAFYKTLEGYIDESGRLF